MCVGILPPIIRNQLPPMLKDQFACTKRCFMSDRCAVFHRAVEAGTVESSGMGNAFTEVSLLIFS